MSSVHLDIRTLSDRLVDIYRGGMPALGFMHTWATILGSEERESRRASNESSEEAPSVENRTNSRLNCASPWRASRCDS